MSLKNGPPALCSRLPMNIHAPTPPPVTPWYAFSIIRRVL